MSTVAIDARDVTKIYRRYTHKKQFATLKSALLQRSIVRDLRDSSTPSTAPAPSFPARAHTRHSPSRSKTESS